MQQEPELTVVVPSRNRAGSLVRTLEALASQSLERSRYEVVVVLDGPTDDSTEAVGRLVRDPAWTGPAVRVEIQEWAGAAAARNTGLREALAPVVLFVDDDTRADRGLVEAHLAEHAHAPPEGLLVLGRIDQVVGTGRLHVELEASWAKHFRRLAEGAQPGWTDVFTGNLSVTRRAALAVGGFNTGVRSGEDVEFGHRLESAGARLVYADRAVLSTRDDKSPVTILADLARGGRSAVQMWRETPATYLDSPLAAYAHGRPRERVARRVLLSADRAPGGRRLVDVALSAWSTSGPERGSRTAFRVVRDFCFWRGVRDEATTAEWGRLASPGVPVLMYHSVDPEPARDRYTVPPRRFARQMRLLRLLRRTVVGLDDLVRDWEEGRPPPGRAVALTFDDGYRDSLDRAWPVLQRLGYPATLFVVTGRAGGTNRWDTEIGRPEKPLLALSEVARLDAAGFRAESHTVTHSDLRTVDPARVRAEVTDSRRDLATALGRPVDLLAHPYGGRSPLVDTEVAAAGYRAAFSVRPGLNRPRTSRWDRPRVEVRGTDGVLRFAAKVLTGHDPVERVGRRLGHRLPRALRQRLAG